MNSEKFKVEKIILSNEESYTPVLLNFQNGTLDKNIISSIDYFEAVNQKTKKKIAVLTTPNGNIYNGEIGNCTSDNLMNTYIAIKNKKTNKVRIIQIEQASMINHIYDEKNSEDSMTNIKSNVDENVLKHKLLKNFGGRKAMRVLERNERMKVNVDIVKEQLNQTIEKSEINDSNNDSQQNIEDNIEAIRPPLNKDAKSIEDIYSITDIIPRELLNRLNDECYHIIETDLESIPIKSEFIKNQIKKIKECRDPGTEQNLLDLKILLYMDGLINLIKTRQRIMSKIELSKITEKIENHIRENFSDPNLKIRTKSVFSSHKALCYFITLALLLNRNYEIGINVLIQELSTPKVKISKYARIVNCQVKPGTDILRLQLPGKIKTKMIVQNRRTK